MVKEYEVFIRFCKQLSTVAKKAFYPVFTVNIPECHQYKLRRLKAIQQLEPVVKNKLTLCHFKNLVFDFIPRWRFIFYWNLKIK